MVRSKGLVFFIAILFIPLLTSCASIVKGGPQSVTFNSEPTGATVIVNGRTMGATPLTVSLERKGGDQSITFEKDGYKPITIPLTTGVNPWFFGNIIFGGLVGSTTDALSGAIHEYSPNFYHVTLSPKGSAFLTPKGEIESFILSNYGHIISEANSSPKEYMTALFSLLKISKENQINAANEMKGMIIGSENSLVFADKVIDKYFLQAN